MRHRIPLPPALGTSFTVRDAAAVGIHRSRLNAADLARPFHAVRSQCAPTTPRERVQSLVARLRPEQSVSGRTALHIWGYPYPVPWRLDDDIDIVVPTDAVRPRLRGVKGRRLARDRFRRWWVEGVPVIDPLSALFLCSTELSDDQLVMLLEAMMTSADNYPGLATGRPVFSREMILQKLLEWGRFAGCARVRAALARAREHVESPKETETRLLLIANGLSEPVVQHPVFDRGRLVARVDLAYPHLKIAIEYEGDGHRRSPAQWRRDIQRQRELEDLGWIVIRLTELDLRDGGTVLIARVRRAIASR
ncbi:endonuclease domain-containing protein [Microbacterium sp.]|uniref:endonuclease domain-containing protein n=1 Tax=Microbacterium sp. TaxID=51671 RepID=UPI0039E37B6A